MVIGPQMATLLLNGDETDAAERTCQGARGVVARCWTRAAVLPRARFLCVILLRLVGTGLDCESIEDFWR